MYLEVLTTNERHSSHPLMDPPRVLSDDLPELSLPSEVLRARRGRTEQSWTEKQYFLEKKGYLLRPRYRPDWVPSWQETRGAVHTAEDALMLPVMRWFLPRSCCSSPISVSTCMHRRHSRLRWQTCSHKARAYRWRRTGNRGAVLPGGCSCGRCQPLRPHPRFFR